MAKVGRAAFAASRARLEVVTADKTINANESGELYAVDAGGALAITLPDSPPNGARYKFMVIDDPGGAISVTSGATSQPFQGALIHVDSADGTQNVIKADGTATDDDAITLNADTVQGSWIVCVYDADNTRWLLEGVILAETAPAIA